MKASRPLGEAGLTCGGACAAGMATPASVRHTAPRSGAKRREGKDTEPPVAWAGPLIDVTAGPAVPTRPSFGFRTVHGFRGSECHETTRRRRFDERVEDAHVADGVLERVRRRAPVEDRPREQVCL